jgi:RNA polymerase sigma factor (sigma-70 family)
LPEAALSGELHAACVAVASSLLARYRWSLLSAQELAGRCLAVAPPYATQAEIERVARDQYARALYAACQQDGDPQRRERAYTDLRHYLYCAAYQRRPTEAEDLTQEALLLVIAQIGRVHEPGAFQTFALFKLRQVLKATLHREPSGAMFDDELVDPATSAAEIAECRERASVLLAALGRLPEPRQHQVVLLKFFGGLSDEQIGQRLQMTAGSVRVLRHRSLVRLRNDPQLRTVISSSDMPLGL